jgi:A/G-specific adenine glycosylase
MSLSKRKNATQPKSKKPITKVASSQGTAPASIRSNAHLLNEYPSADWFKKFRKAILKWYESNQRRLPWRDDPIPYKVWLSEIMLQQTQVATVVDYFNRFINKFPTIIELANADEQTVLSMWEGLGYYRRARNLHAAAQKVRDDFGGIFPDDFESVLSLPGVGRYSAGAILSIAGDQKLPILEGNTYRLHARLLALHDDPRSRGSESLLWQFAEDLLPTKKCGAFNQSLMELGSEICKPKKPLCQCCPVIKNCAANQLDMADKLPIKSKRRKFVRRHDALFFIENRGQVWVRQRKQGEWWAGLWDFARFNVSEVAETAEKSPPNERLQNHLEAELGIQLKSHPKILMTINHAVTHHKIRLDCYWIKAKFPDAGKQGFKQVTRNELSELPLNVTARKLLSMIEKSC